MEREAAAASSADPGARGRRLRLRGTEGRGLFCVPSPGPIGCWLGAGGAATPLEGAVPLRGCFRPACIDSNWAGGLINFCLFSHRGRKQLLADTGWMSGAADKWTESELQKTSRLLLGCNIKLI
ncbi:hypothetical protein NDU88_006283 [Pleurodeles waltl]|uniref:Uncharacterized protein n=1 Tax=Pleurodeles waltl TaxID=8319 RepID=A0AAV7PID0_PLEWA|nr:hypothetical protein NDU88_006283 [Pleurodeles waltl]